MIIFAYVVIEYLPPAYFSLIWFIFISIGVRELIKLTEPATHSLPVLYLSGLAIAAAFTFGKFEDVPTALMGVVLINGLFFLFGLRKKEALPHFVRDMGIHYLALFYLYFPLYYFFLLKKLHPNYLFFLISVIAIGDTAAYFFGRLIGKHKIYKIASPKKSLEGLIAAIIFAGVSGWLAILVFPLKVDVSVAVITGAIMGLMSQLSDPIESLFKRSADKKDSSNLLPGHGGVLDRVDSYIFCAPALFYIIRYFWT